MPTFKLREFWRAKVINETRLKCELLGRASPRHAFHGSTTKEARAESALEISPFQYSDGSVFRGIYTKAFGEESKSNVYFFLTA